MRDRLLPGKNAHRHILHHRPPERLPAVVTGEKHPQPPAVRGEEVHRQRRGAVVSLPYEGSVRAAERDGLVNTFGDAGALENRVRAVRDYLHDRVPHIIPF